MRILNSLYARIVLGIGLATAILLLLTGDLIWSLGGSRALTIEGQALENGRAAPDYDGWAHYGGDQGGQKFSPLDSINPETVGDLEIAWRYSTGDMDERSAYARRNMSPQATPILIDGRLVFCSPFNEVIALDPKSGEQLWRFTPELDPERDLPNKFACRGVAAGVTESGVSTIYTATGNGRVFALDAASGALLPGFGEGGAVDVTRSVNLSSPDEFQFTSPPVIVDNTVIVGSAIADSIRVNAPLGTVRAYDASSGALKWTFDPLLREATGDPIYGRANAWAPLSVDEERRLVFIPTSSPSPDHFGGLRPGNNEHANSIVALEIDTGEVRWAFQVIHHDVWDYDLPAQPNLVTIVKDGREQDVVAQVTKTGFVFVLDRDTGEPVWPVEERAVPQSTVEGETLSATQPFPTAPPPLVPITLSEDDAWGITGLDKMYCRSKIAGADNKGLFTPPSERGTIQRPFFGGGANWGGAAYDPTRNLLVVNMSNLASKVRLVPNTREPDNPDIMLSPYREPRNILNSPFGIPCTRPPWGVLAGVDLSTGEIVWRQTFGTIRDLSGGLLRSKLGAPNIGGPIMTGGGLIFIGASMDDYLRAFDSNTGKELWRARLPAGGQATPMTYEFDGRQYIVIYAGGHAQLGTRPGDEILAFALPEGAAD